MEQTNTKSFHCENCNKKISVEINEQYNGYCEMCYEKIYGKTNSSNLNTYHKISILYFIIIIISSLIITSNTTFYTALPILFAGFISFFLFYMISTIIQELRNINRN